MTREVQVRLYVSQLLSQEECQQADLDLEAKREVDTNFQVGLFDFPISTTPGCPAANAAPYR